MKKIIGLVAAIVGVITLTACTPSVAGSTNKIDAGCNIAWGEVGQTSPHVWRPRSGGAWCMFPASHKKATAELCVIMLNGAWGIRTEHRALCGVGVAT